MNTQTEEVDEDGEESEVAEEHSTQEGSQRVELSLDQLVELCRDIATVFRKCPAVISDDILDETVQVTGNITFLSLVCVCVCVCVCAILIDTLKKQTETI
jgi:hypothetical protein